MNQNRFPCSKSILLLVPCGALLLAPLPALAQSTNFFTDGYGGNAFPLDKFPGFTGEDLPGGWSTEWRITRSGVQSQLDTTNVIATTPLNSGGNYLNWNTWGPAGLSGGASLARKFTSTNNTLDVSLPYVVEFDYRLDMHVRASGVPDFTQFNNSSDYAAIAMSDSFGNDIPSGGGFVVKATGAASSGSPNLAPKFFGFFDGGLAAAGEAAGTYINSTNVPFATNHTYHFKFQVDPTGDTKTYEGTVTDLVTGLGFNTTAAVGRKLNWKRSNSNPTQMSNTTVLTFIGRQKTANATNVFSVDSIVVYQLPRDLLPVVVSPVQPVKSATFYPASSNFIFNAFTYGFTNSLPASNVSLVLNGVNVNAALSFTGTDASSNRTVTYSGLQDNTVYTAFLSVADQAGRRTTNGFFFDTFNTNNVVVLEAENYNFEWNTNACQGIQDDVSRTDRYIQGWLYGGVTTDGQNLVNLESSYYDRLGLDGIDFHTTVTNAKPATAVFRDCDGLKFGTQSASDDYRRPWITSLNLNEYVLTNTGTNEWWNYTHEYPAGNYYAYLRAGAASFNFTNRLDLVTSSYALPGQTTTKLGVFAVPLNAPPFTRAQVLHDYLLQDDSGNPALLSLNGKTTLRLTVINGDTATNNNQIINYLVLVPLQTATSAIQISNPVAAGTDFAFSFNGDANAHYTIQYKNSVSTASWSTLTTVTGTGTAMTVHDASGSSGRVYRIQSP
jgi:hypothetical protein